MAITFLNLNDLDDRIHEFERRYDTTSVEMLKDESKRSQIPEDVLLKWETYITQRLHLREINRDRHSSYLGSLTAGRKSAPSKTEADELSLAA